MLSLAKNERGIRLASAAIILLPVAFLVFSTSHSQIVNLVALLSWFAFAAVALIAFLFEKAEEDDKRD